ncbi:MAG: hypothetical protein ACYC64_19240 [Armatimonadota bacterium]
MLRAFWTWDPCRDSKWFFDKSVWQRMFRAMSGCGLDAIILANTHPFPHMMDLSADYPESRVLDDVELARYQDMHHWIFENALDYGLAPYLLFFPMRYPDRFAGEQGVAIEYTHRCVRTLLESYSELSGLFASVDEPDAKFIQQTVVDAMDAARPDAPLYLRCPHSEPSELVTGIARRGGRPINYSVKYTGDHLVDANPDPSFVKWTEAVGAKNVLAEFPNANFEPWSSFSFDTVEGILGNLREINCGGFSLMPLSPLDWPCSSDTYFKYQFQRDLVWYSVWGGSDVSQLLREGQPKWLLRNKRVVEGFQAGSRILELLSLYVAGDKTDGWRPQFCSVVDPDTNAPRLLSIRDMLHFDDDSAFSGRKWWMEITGDEVVHPAEYVKSGTPENAYGPDELIEELADLSEQAVAAGEKGMRNNSGEKELPGLTRDAFCMGRLGEFYVERFKAALAHARSEGTEALEHMNRALGLYREIRGVDSFHRRTDCIPAIWTATIKALEAEYEDASTGEFKPGTAYPVT